MGKAIVEAMRERREVSVLFVGTRRGLEEKVLCGEDMKLEYIDTRGLKGMGLRGWLQGMLLIPRSLRQSSQILKSFRPHLAVGLGGYSAGPVLWQASRQGIATLIIEPNVLPGITNRWLNRRADAVAVAFEETRMYLGPRCHVTGVPVRKEFFAGASMSRDPHRFRLLIFGGSQGSRRINQWVSEALPRLKAEWKVEPSALEIVHQTGEADYARVLERYRSVGMAADIRPFIDNMPEEMGWANLVVCRAGAGTVGELCAAGRASLLIPFAQAADQHQLRNAQALERRGAAVLMQERVLNADRLAARILELAAQPQLLARMEGAARRLARADAAEKIADLASQLLERHAA